MPMIDKNLINLEGNVATQKEMFHYLADLAFQEDRAKDSTAIEQGLNEREAESTTGFGKHIAIPHTKNSAVKEPTVIMVRNQQSLEWNSLDGQPVETIINLLVPDNQSDTHLKMLAKLSRQMMHADFTDVLKTGTKEEILTMLTKVLSD